MRLPTLQRAIGARPVLMISDERAVETIFQSSARNLIFVGILRAFAIGPLTRFVHGTKHAAAPSELGR